MRISRIEYGIWEGSRHEDISNGEIHDKSECYVYAQAGCTKIDES
jgi:hypothetical protein